MVRYVHLLYRSSPSRKLIQFTLPAGVGALPFLALALGLFLGLPISIYCAGIYRQAAAASPTGRAAPEQRLYFAMVGFYHP